jgi:transposase
VIRFFRKSLIREEAMEHVAGRSRHQSELMPASLDEIIGLDNVVRVIDGFVDGLDLRRLEFQRVETAATGRPPYAPGDLLKLYIYGYMNQMRSSRRLEREAQRNLEVCWLIDRLRPSFKTIADFRRDHAQAIVATCREFISFCRGQSMMGGAIAAIDGTKILAVASRKKVVTTKALEERLAAVEAKVRDHLKAMDEADREEGGEDEARVDVKAAIEALEQQRKDIQRQAEALTLDGLSQRVEGEEEARLMRTPRHGPQVAYNAQIAVDSKHKLIAAFELTNEGNDERQLYPMAVEAKEALDVESLTVVADTGYSNGEQGEQCARDGIVAIVPRPVTVNPKGEGLFTREAFAYDAANDAYRCPAGQTLTRFKVSNTEKKWEYRTSACGDCALKTQCTKAAHRSIVRGFYENARQAMDARAKADRSWMKLRLGLVEHPFATMKWMMGSPRFLVRGLTKAKSELALGVLGFNLKRMMAILGAQRLTKALATEAG